MYVQLDSAKEDFAKCKQRDKEAQSRIKLLEGERDAQLDGYRQKKGDLQSQIKSAKESLVTRRRALEVSRNQEMVAREEVQHARHRLAEVKNEERRRRRRNSASLFGALVGFVTGGPVGAVAGGLAGRAGGHLVAEFDEAVDRAMDRVRDREQAFTEASGAVQHTEQLIAKQQKELTALEVEIMNKESALI